MRFVVGAKSDVGRGRSANEDSFLVDEADRLYAVADGMGGHRAGEVASATAIERLQAAFQDGADLDEAVEEANAAVFAKASANLDMRGMGTTLTALAILDGDTALLGHVGDSRAYLMRDGGVTRITDDHSLVEQLVREGRLSPEEAANHPQRAIITRALGVDPEVEVDTYRVDLRPGDRIVLCSDGLTNMVSEDDIAAVLYRRADPHGAAEALVDLANEAGGDDNITVVVVDAKGDAATEGAMASAALGAEAPDEPTGEWIPFEDDAGEKSEEAPPPPVEVAGEEETATGKAAGRAAGRRPRRLSRRVATWLVPILFLVGLGVAAVGWYARSTFYVGVDGGRVTLFRGVPGGVLGWEPTVEERSHLSTADLTPAERVDLENGHRFSNRADALRFLERLETRAGAATAPAAVPGSAEPGNGGGEGAGTTTTTFTTFTTRSVP